MFIDNKKFPFNKYDRVYVYWTKMTSVSQCADMRTRNYHLLSPRVSIQTSFLYVSSSRRRIHEPSVYIERLVTMAGG